MATAPKVYPSEKDVEIGGPGVFNPATAKPKGKLLDVSPPPTGPLKSPLFPELYSLGLTKGRGKRKTKKGKKQPRKTKKHLRRK